MFQVKLFSVRLGGGGGGGGVSGVNGHWLFSRMFLYFWLSVSVGLPTPERPWKHLSCSVILCVHGGCWHPSRCTCNQKRTWRVPLSPSLVHSSSLHINLTWAHSQSIWDLLIVFKFNIKTNEFHMMHTQY